MAGRLLTLGARFSAARLAPLGSRNAASSAGDIRLVIGNREMVGYGVNGEPGYMDRGDIPLPALRWKEPTPDILALRQKEKGDWKKLSKEEKKALYRAAFCQTFAEMNAPTGEWKSILGTSLVLISLGFWLFFGLKLFVYSPLPESFKEESRKAQLRRMIDMRNNPISGIASEWDYEKDDWKK